MKPLRHRFPAAAGGMSLIELMIALVLGLLISAGIVAVFMGVSTSNRVQSGLSRLQESGRFLVSRMNMDLGMGAAQYCATLAGSSPVTANGIQPTLHAMNLRVPNFTFPDWSGPPQSGTDPVMLSPRFLLQGFDCGAGGCAPTTPALPTLPPTGTAAGNRVTGSDVLTVRYLRGRGWRVASCNAATGITLSGDRGPADGDLKPPLNADHWAAGDIALLSDCSSAPVVFNAIQAGNGVAPNPMNFSCPGAATIGGGDVRVFNFSKDFISVTYFLRLRADENPDRAGRLIPVLMRRETGANGVALEQELAQGVERLDFLYAVDDAAGATAYLTAAEVNARTLCTPGPEGVRVNEPGCG